MSQLAWCILALFIEKTQTIFKGEYGRGYIAAWALGEALGGDANTINAIDTKIAPRNEYEAALKELIDLGLVMELPDLHERFRLVVKEAK